MTNDNYTMQCRITFGAKTILDHTDTVPRARQACDGLAKSLSQQYRDNVYVVETFCPGYGWANAVRWCNGRAMEADDVAADTGRQSQNAIA